MKYLNLFSIFFIAFLVNCFGQTIPLDPANGWIMSGQTYIRIITVEEGIYHVTINEFANAGFNLSSVNPNNLHLIYRGVEQPIYVSQIGNQLNFLEFYANVADGEDEIFLYRDNFGEIDSSIHPNPKTSLITKESVFFLTWDGQSGLRYTDYAAFDYGNYLQELSYRTSVAQNYSDVLVQESPSMGAITFESNPNYISGEGYAGHFFRDSFPTSFLLQTPRQSQNGDTSELRLRGFGNTIGGHETHVQLGFNLILACTSLSFETFNCGQRFNQYLSPTTTVIVSEDLQGGSFLTRLEIKYSKDFYLDGASEERVLAYTNGNDAYFHWKFAAATDYCWLYDLTRRRRILGTVTQETNGRDLHLIVPADTVTRDFFLVTDNGFRSAVRIEPARLEDYAQFAGVEFVIIANRSLEISAEAYSSYRDSSQTNPMSAAVFYTDAIFDEFGFGAPSPLAIKRFVMTAVQNWTIQPKYILLWGKAKNDSRNASGNLVPSWGYPAFDLEYISNFNSSPVDYHPLLPIGRIPATSDAQGLNYLTKVKRYEAYSFEPWMLNGLFLSYDIVGNGYVSSLQMANDSALFATTAYAGNALFYRSDSSGTRTFAPITAHQAIDNGVAWIDIKDHALDNSIGYLVDIQEPASYGITGKYPFVNSIGWRTTYCLDDTLLLAEKWILEPQKGAIGFVGPSNYSFSGPMYNYTTNFLSLAFNNTTGLAIGELMDSAYSLAVDQHHVSTPRLCDFVLLGDPSIVIVNPFTTAIQEIIKNEFQFSVFPIPFSTNVQFDFVIAKSATLNCEVFDLTGKSVFFHQTKVLTSGQHRINCDGSQLLPGIYIAKFQVDDVAVTRKLIKM